MPTSCTLDTYWTTWISFSLSLSFLAILTDHLTSIFSMPAVSLSCVSSREVSDSIVSLRKALESSAVLIRSMTLASLSLMLTSSARSSSLKG